MAEEPKRTRAKKTPAETPKRPRKASTPRTRSAKAQPKAEVGHETIAFRAYELFEQGAPGDALEHWLAAERELAAA